jgi:ribosomal protein L13E
VIDEASGLEMLRQICCTADKVAEYSETIERDGPILRTKAGVKEHPLIRHVQTGRSFIVRSLHKLGLDIIEPRSGAGRPNGDYRGERR